MYCFSVLLVVAGSQLVTSSVSMWFPRLILRIGSHLGAKIQWMTLGIMMQKDFTFKVDLQPG